MRYCLSPVPVPGRQTIHIRLPVLVAPLAGRLPSDRAACHPSRTEELASCIVISITFVQIHVEGDRNELVRLLKLSSQEYGPRSCFFRDITYPRTARLDANSG